MSTQLATVTKSPTPLFGLSTMAEAMEFSNQMAKAKLLPAHLQNSPADCLRVIMQAARWQFDPFAVAEKTSVISGKLMYEGQLVTAVVNSRGNMSKRLAYTFEGEGDKRVLTVTGTIEGESEPRTIKLPFDLAKRINKNGQMNINPDQQACYIGARIWARRHMPELMMGVYTPDEIDPEDLENVTPDPQSDAVKGAGLAERRATPQRETKGAAAVASKEADKKSDAIDVSATKVKEPAKKEEQPEKKETPTTPPPANAADDFDLPANPPVEEIVVTELKKDERLKVRCVFKSVSAEVRFKTVNGTKSPFYCVFTELDGGFRGSATHINGAKQDGERVVPISPLYVVGGKAYLTIVGMERANGTVGNVIEAIEAAP